MIEVKRFTGITRVSHSPRKIKFHSKVKTYVIPVNPVKYPL